MKLIVGLGNPGDKYRHTRHNVGFLAVQKYALSNNFSEWTNKDKLKGKVATSGEGEDKIILLMPQTYMNLSGEAVQATKQFFKLDNSDITVLHDEVDIPFGEIRSKSGGGTAGHNGLESVVAHIGDDFARVRIGIRNPVADLAETSDFVLANFSKAETEKLDHVLSLALAKLEN